MSRRLDAATIARLREDPRHLCSPTELVALLNEVEERRAADLGQYHLTALRWWAREALVKDTKTRLEADAVTAVLLIIAAHGETT